MAKAYRISQRVVLEAIQELLQQGILVRQPSKRGFFIAAKPLPNSASTNLNQQADSKFFTRPLEQTYYIRPLPVRQTISIYVSDVHPDHLAVWQEVLDDFIVRHRSLRLEILSPKNGHIEEILAERSVDVVHAERLILRKHAACFQECVDLCQVGIAERHLLAPISRWLQKEKTRVAIPFSLTIPFLYVNQALCEDFEAPENPVSVESLLAHASRVENSAGCEAVYGYLFPDLCYWFFLCGAFSDCGEDRWRIDQKQMTRALHLLRHAGLRSKPNDGADRLLFCQGRVLYCLHSSFFTLYLRQAQFPWTAVPHPTPNKIYDAQLLCLARHREVKEAEAAADLIRYLMGDVVQLRFAALHGNLPPLEQHAFAPEILATHPIPGKTLRQVVDSSSLLWPWSENAVDVYWRVNALAGRFFAGELNAEEVLRRVTEIRRTGWENTSVSPYGQGERHATSKT